MRDVAGSRKRTVRQLRRLEKIIRFGRATASDVNRVWSQFFGAGSRYSGAALAALDKAAFKRIIAEYFYSVYYQKYKEGGLALADMYNPALLSRLDLPPDADYAAIKARFRQLAKLYHPDHGGDAAQMLALLETFHKLTQT